MPIVLTPTQRGIYEFILMHGYSDDLWKKVGFKYKQQIYPYLNVLLASGYLREQPKYKAVRKE